MTSVEFKQEIKIEKDVPQPLNYSGWQPALPIEDMKVGDSFFVPTTGERILLSQRIRYQIVVFRKRKQKDYKFTVRLMNGGVRCWRIK